MAHEWQKIHNRELPIDRRVVVMFADKTAVVSDDRADFIVYRGHGIDLRDGEYWRDATRSTD